MAVNRLQAGPARVTINKRQENLGGGEPMSATWTINNKQMLPTSPREIQWQTEGV